MLKAVEKLVKHGFSVHLLKKNSKAPANSDWSSIPNLSYRQLTDQYKAGMNLGVRTGKWSKVAGHYLHIIDLDIRTAASAEEAYDVLETILPDYLEYPVVMSGSGGESRHFYFLSPKPLRSKKIAHSDTFKMVHDARLKRDVKKYDWEIDLFGTGKQAVLPPSIHPDTGKPYVWLKPFDFIDLAVGDGPIIDDDTLANLNADDAESGDYDRDDPRYQPLGLDMEEIERIVSKLPADEWIEDREGWYRMGMGIHHETGGSKAGFDLWIKYSKKSGKFDLRDAKSVWKSFKNRHRPFRMASLQSVVRDIEQDERIESMEFDDLDDDMDDMPAPKKRSLADELLGDMDDDEDGLEFEDLGPEPGDEYLGTKRSNKIKKAEKEAELGKKVPRRVAEYNKNHAVVRVKGKTLIVTEFKDGSSEFGSVTDFNNWSENDRVATDKSTVPFSRYWIQHKARRQYSQGVVFDPKNDDPDYYNLWKGWSVEPGDPDGCPLFLDHTLNIICRGDPVLFRYTMGWLAHMIQRPEDKPGVAVAVRGRKGAGKDTIAEYFSGLLRHHYMMVNQKEHLTGRFNDHQKNLMFLHVEEGYWAGSKQDEGPLKSIITSPTVTIEPKGVNAFQINSILRIFMTSNEQWVVPASGPDERRYFVVDADDAWSRSGRLGRDPVRRKAYFDALRHEMNNGGRAALLAYLMEYDLAGFDVRDPPETAALDEQKLAGLKNVDRWWADQLMDGELAFDPLQLSSSHYSHWSRESVMVVTELMLDAYEAWFKKQRYQGDLLSEIQFFKRMHELTGGKCTRSRRRINGQRKYTIELPKLTDCRKEFDKAYGTKLDWKQFEIVDEDPLEIDDMGDEI